MTFTEIVNLVQTRLNLTSADSLKRIGIEVNDRHRRITSSLGMLLTRRITTSATATIGQTTLTFTGVEKLINIVDRSVNPYRVLKEISVEELRAQQPSPNTFVSYYCIVNMSWNSVTVEMDCVPGTTFVLFADALQNAATLSGSMEPAFPESFHDVLVHGALEDEYLKLEKVKLAADSGLKYANRLSDLRYFFAKSSYIDWVQGKTRGTIYEEGVPGAGGGAGPGQNIAIASGVISAIDSSGASLGLTVNASSYYAIGSLVFITLDVTYPVTTNTLNASIGGLPFANISVRSALSQMTGFGLEWLIPSGGTVMNPYILSTGIPATNLNLSGLTIVISGCYSTLGH